jgi:hypothetical protein
VRLDGAPYHVFTGLGEDQSRAELQMAEQTRADFLSALELNPGAPELIAELQELDKIICRCQRRIEQSRLQPELEREEAWCPVITLLYVGDEGEGVEVLPFSPSGAYPA